MIASNICTPPDPDIATDVHSEYIQPTLNLGFAMSQQSREELLHGPTVLLVVSHSGTIDFDYTHQFAAARGIVHHDRMRQLQEQAESNNRCFTIEFPANALAAASLVFR